MTKFLAKVLVIAIATIAITNILPGIHVDSFTTSLIVAFALVVLNATLGLFIKIVTFPISLLTLGCFSFVINGVIVIVADQLIAGFTVADFGSAFLFALILSILTSFIEGAFKDKKK